MDEELYPKSPILVVDDEKNFLKSINFCLRSEGITNFECCQKSREVMPRLKKKKYSLILLDLIMPHLSGEDLLPKINEEYPEIPVIILTAYGDIKKAVECVKRGAFDFLQKPVDTPSLLEKVRSGLDFIGKAPQAVIDKISPEIKNKKIDRGNVSLFYDLGQAYESIEDFGKAVDLYRDVSKFDPNYTGIHEKLEKIEKLKRDIITIYHKERYEIIKEVGKGAIGVVYKAKDTILDRMVALKILHKRPVPKKIDIERFMSEAKKVAKLQHVNIVSVYDCGQIENDYFISMEFIKGKDLGTIIREKHRIQIPDILIIAKKLFAALDHSHRHGVIHRDVKPGNIMITSENEVKVVDFGIAALRDDLKRDNSTIYGTPLYMSPDQYENSTIDHQSDIYSAGVTLFHLVTGIVPFKGSPEEIIRQHLKEPVPPIKKYRDDIPEKLIKIIEKCMEKKKEDRYPRASQVIKELDRIRDRNGNAYITTNTKLKILDKSDIDEIIPETDQDTEPYGDKFIDEIDILTFAYHLVLSSNASPELLIDPNHILVKNAIQKICPEEKESEELVTALKLFEDKYSDKNPNPLWHSWIMTTQGEKINQVKEMLKEMIRHE
jgi:serine/threonine protein kinase/CheY-like chemotaxis protein